MFRVSTKNGFIVFLSLDDVFKYIIARQDILFSDDGYIKIKLEDDVL